MTKIITPSELHQLENVAPKTLHILDKCKLLDTSILQANDTLPCSDSYDFKKDIDYLERKKQKKTVSDDLNIRFLNWVYENKNHDIKLKYGVIEAVNCMNYWKQYGFDYDTTTCKKRHCLVCQNNRTGKLINSYLPSIENFKEDIYFTTLTKEAVSLKYLKRAIDDNIKTFGDIVRNIKKTYGKKVIALRTLETTYNPITNKYHTHIHALIHQEDTANLVVKLWFDKWNKKSSKYKCNINAQDIRKADIGSLKELLKYCTKLDKKTDFMALFNILATFKSRRLFQAYGVKADKKQKKTKEPKKIYINGRRDTIYFWNKNFKDKNWYDTLNNPIV